MLNVGTKVRVKKGTELACGLIKEGVEGVVIEKYTPFYCTGVWSWTIKFNADWCPVQLSFPLYYVEEVNN
jgi:hypothetical protein